MTDNTTIQIDDNPAKIDDKTRMLWLELPARKMPSRDRSGDVPIRGVVRVKLDMIDEDGVAWFDIHIAAVGELEYTNIEIRWAGEWDYSVGELRDDGGHWSWDDWGVIDELEEDGLYVDTSPLPGRWDFLGIYDAMVGIAEDNINEITEAQR